MGYKIGGGFHLYRATLANAQFELMDIDCTNFTGRGPQNVLISEIVRECFYCGYKGVVLGIGGHPTLSQINFCRDLSSALSKYDIDLYLPERFAAIIDSAKVLVPAQNTKGSFEAYLSSLLQKYGAARIALELERVYTDFALPVKSGVGAMLSQNSFDALSKNSSTFFSDTLCANYISYIKDRRAHLVIWDDADSLSLKLTAAGRLGIGTAFLYYPHVKDIISDIKFLQN
jgi:hypothetical protein